MKSRFPFMRAFSSASTSTTLAHPLKDLFNRQHTYLRISLTERCNLRCTYCMPEEGVPLTASEKLLTGSEIDRLSRLFVSLGVSKVRLTGGEPSIRRDLIEITDRLDSLRPSGLKSIGMTSNGIALERKLASLKMAGMDSLNISLDTLDPLKFPIITRRLGFEKVVKCIDTALDLEFDNVKVNCVLMRGVNDDEYDKFVEFARDRDVTVRFIEYMPFDGNKWNNKKMIPYYEIIDRIELKYGKMQKIVGDKSDTAKNYSIEGIKGRIGFITSMSNHFCGGCNRLRITADGNLKVCLFGPSEISLRDLMREGRSDEDLVNVISNAVKRKKFSHAGMDTIAKTKNRPMILIGDRNYVHIDNLLTMNNPPLINQYRAHSTFSHFDSNNKAKMVDVGGKKDSSRTATASAEVIFPATVYQLVKDHVEGRNINNNNNSILKKGDLFTVSQVAGIMAAKKTHDLIPMCHQLSLNHVSISFEMIDEMNAIKVLATCSCTGKTGVEMEALTAASLTSLTIYDMCKALDKSIRIHNIHLISKTGGKSGNMTVL